MSPVGSLFGWVLWAMVTWCPTRSYERFVEYQRVAEAIDRVATSDADAADLASIGSLESGYDRHAVNRRTHARGVWQLMPPVPCRRDELECEAREALRRWKVQGAAGYTGEAARMSGSWPLAHERQNRATIWMARHPAPTRSP